MSNTRLRIYCVQGPFGVWVVITEIWLEAIAWLFSKLSFCVKKYIQSYTFLLKHLSTIPRHYTLTIQLTKGIENMVLY